MRNRQRISCLLQQSFVARPNRPTKSYPCCPLARRNETHMGLDSHRSLWEEVSPFSRKTKKQDVIWEGQPVRPEVAEPVLSGRAVNNNVRRRAPPQKAGSLRSGSPFPVCYCKASGNEEGSFF